MTVQLKQALLESIEIKKLLLNKVYLDKIKQIGDLIIKSITDGNKVMLCGNGGSAADAQHLAAEMLVRLRPKINRQALAAISLTLDVSTITACGNDLHHSVAAMIGLFAVVSDHWFAMRLHINILY